MTEGGRGTVSPPEESPRRVHMDHDDYVHDLEENRRSDVKEACRDDMTPSKPTTMDVGGAPESVAENSSNEQSNEKTEEIDDEDRPSTAAKVVEDDAPIEASLETPAPPVKKEMRDEAIVTGGEGEMGKPADKAGPPLQPVLQPETPGRNEAARVPETPPREAYNHKHMYPPPMPYGYPPPAYGAPHHHPHYPPPPYYSQQYPPHAPWPYPSGHPYYPYGAHPPPPPQAGGYAPPPRGEAPGDDTEANASSSKPKQPPPPHGNPPPPPYPHYAGYPPPPGGYPPPYHYPHPPQPHSPYPTYMSPILQQPIFSPGAPSPGERGAEGSQPPPPFPPPYPPSHGGHPPPPYDPNYPPGYSRGGGHPHGYYPRPDAPQEGTEAKNGRPSDSSTHKPGLSDTPLPRLPDTHRHEAQRPPLSARKSHEDPSVADDSQTTTSETTGSMMASSTGDHVMQSTKLKTYIKAAPSANEENRVRKLRKNEASRRRAAALKDRIAMLEKQDPSTWNEEERQIMKNYEDRRGKKNNRSKERALEKKEEVDRILAKPANSRTKLEIQFLDSVLNAKKRKNEGDRLRRQRLKVLGFNKVKLPGKPRVPARGPLPPELKAVEEAVKAGVSPSSTVTSPKGPQGGQNPQDMPGGGYHYAYSGGAWEATTYSTPYPPSGYPAATTGYDPASHPGYPPPAYYDGVPPPPQDAMDERD